ncbi:efflux RND transporter periplasmic adaptor subunit [Acidisoma silvae]|uniref:Efflux RND transporter periplasmic adaptor subunit n=1 Tax=Acidisoma silvae TaxID=2802396 RepID=A0A963YW93_9PROT|nr:efflux RND transporter periplasmic adaptor subunit [Acidisoma silvae]MCB8877313.1 efflux RND transporter periplasmic adaptor subunit [Acidisoma silvae]
MKLNGVAQRGVAVSALALIVGLSACKKSNTYVAPPPPEVSVTVPLVHDVRRHLETTGNVVALNSVDLVARIQGFLYSQNYTDGAMVKSGGTLFTIEPPPYYAQLQQAQAQQAAAQANLVQAQQQFARQAQLRTQNVNSQADYDNAQAKQDAAQADVDNAIASTQLAAINYSYTQVKAPYDGQVSTHLVSVGQMVGAGGEKTKLATIVQIKPIYVYFSLSEPVVQRIRAALKAMGKTIADVHNIPIGIGLQTETGYPHIGELDYVAPTVDADTGTLTARALMTNTDLSLLPGMFVRVQVPAGVDSNAILVPDTAIGSDQAGSYVLVVDAQNEVQQKSVTTSTLVDGLRVVDKGLLPTDKVIVDGLQRAIPGEKVAPQTAPPLTAPADIDSAQ